VSSTSGRNTSPPIGRGVIDQFRQPQPPSCRRVLTLAVKLRPCVRLAKATLPVPHPASANGISREAVADQMLVRRGGGIIHRSSLRCSPSANRMSAHRGR
jgi:hypothetical protein